VLGLLTVRSSSRGLIRRFNAVAAACYLASVVALLAGTAVGHWEPAGVPWLMAQSTVAVAAAVTGSGMVAGLVVTLGIFAGTITLRALDHDLGIGDVIDDAHLVFFGLLVTTFAGFISAARRYDETARRAADAVAATAAAAASRAARERMEALVHDEVFTALLLGSQRIAAAASAQARRALALLDQVDAPTDDRSLPVSILVRWLDRTVQEVAPSARVDLDGWADLTLPGYVADALTDAVRQALVNAVRHAPGAIIDVAVAVGEHGVRISVADDGPGFDLASVPSHRMGVSVSILGRVNALPGASAAVAAQPGSGTIVSLAWSPEPGRTLTPSAADGLLRRRTWLGVVAFLLGQGLLGTLALADGTPWGIVLAAYAGIAGGQLILDWRHLDPPTPLRTAMSVGCCWLVGAMGWARSPHNAVAADWYLVGMGIVAASIAIRGRMVAALIAVGGGVALGASGLLTQQATSLSGEVALTAPVLAVLWALACSVALRLIRTRTARLALAELADVDRRSAEAARLETLAERARAVTDLVAPTLTALSTAQAVTDGLASECRALEGHLRDDFRGGRLARQPLVGAARAARLRGVDVVLLDDGPGRELPEATLTALHRWMADELSSIPRDGRFTGRILPTGRGGIASAVTADRAEIYPG